MAKRKANAVWNGNLKEGNGKLRTETGSIDKSYSFSSRFEEGAGTNPEELIAAAHAACFSMAFAGNLEKAGFKPEKVETEDVVHLEKQEVGFTITKIEINTKAKAPGIDEKTFNEAAEKTKQGCPVARALTGVEFVLNAQLV